MLLTGLCARGKAHACACTRARVHVRVRALCAGGPPAGRVCGCSMDAAAQAPHFKRPLQGHPGARVLSRSLPQHVTQGQHTPLLWAAGRALCAAPGLMHAVTSACAVGRLRLTRAGAPACAVRCVQPSSPAPRARTLVCWRVGGSRVQPGGRRWRG